MDGRWKSSIFYPRSTISSKNLGDLHRVEGGTLADLVTDDPEIQGVVENNVFADAADEAIVLAGGVQGHGENLVSRIIDHLNAGLASEGGAG